VAILRRGDDLAIKAVGFDLFGTLIRATADGNVCLRGIYDCLNRNGVDATYEIFVETYRAIRMRQRQTSQAEHREVTNSETVCETARLLGHDLQPTSPTVRDAVRAYFRPWELRLMDGASSTLDALRPVVKLGLVSNFTDVSFVEEALESLGIHDFFDSIIVSAGCGWRKPSPRIFQILFSDLGVKPEECIFIGDEVESDIKGAKSAGMLAALVSSEATASDSVTGANFVIGSLEDIVPIVRRLT